MSCTFDRCTCHRDAGTERAHGVLLDHMAGCSQCRDENGAVGKSQMCPTGLKLYQALVEAFRAADRRRENTP
jgi:hypothetical protein